MCGVHTPGQWRQGPSTIGSRSFRSPPASVRANGNQDGPRRRSLLLSIFDEAVLLRARPTLMTSGTRFADVDVDDADGFHVWAETRTALTGAAAEDRSIRRSLIPPGRTAARREDPRPAPAALSDDKRHPSLRGARGALVVSEGIGDNW